MKSFIKPSEIKPKKERASMERVALFISRFNYLANRQEEKEFYLNDMLDKLPMLTDADFERVQPRAKKAGWNITRESDNYQTTQYKVKPIKK